MKPAFKDVFAYLCVDSFLDSFIHARALRTAYEVGLIEDLSRHRIRSLEELMHTCGMDKDGLILLLGLLSENKVIETLGGRVQLSHRFQEALSFNDILLAKLEFSHLVTSDFTDFFPALLTNPEHFVRNARIFHLFRTTGSGPEEDRWTQRWMRFTTSLTKYEAQVAMHFHDFSRYRNMLDIGGNSGEFALQLCRRYDNLRATVFDLPIVCDIGRRYVDATPEADRIEFVKGSAFADDLPVGADLITFKSMLHDWPEQEVKLLLDRAARVLAPDGTLLIYERGPLDIGKEKIPYSMLPYLLFFRFFRSPVMYEDQLGQLGFRDIEIQTIDLETQFHLLTAKR